MNSEIPWERSQLLNHLRESDGDIVVRLTPSPSEWLVLDRKELAKGSPMLISLLNPLWGITPTSMPHPVTGIQSDMWVLSLVWDGVTFNLSQRNGDQPLPAFSSPSSPMTPKYSISRYTLPRDSLYDGVHPGILAAHDLFVMFALLYDLPVALEHLPLRPQTDPRDIVRLGIERLASIITYTDYYCAVTLLSSRQLVLKDLLFQYLMYHTKDVFKYGTTSPWVELLGLSRDLQFPELYIFVLLELGNGDLDPTELDDLASVLGLDSADQAAELMRKVQTEYMAEHRDQMGMVVHIPLMGLPTYKVDPPMQISHADRVSHNAHIIAGSIWEAHMRDWAFWRGLFWRDGQYSLSGEQSQWKQRFPRYGLFQYGDHSIRGPLTVPGLQHKYVPKHAPDSDFELGDREYPDAWLASYIFFISRLRPAILANNKPGLSVFGTIFDPRIVETCIDLAYQKEASYMIHGQLGVTAYLDKSDVIRREFVAKVQSLLTWYVDEAAAIFKTSLKPKEGSSWDLSFTGDNFTWAEDTPGVDVRDDKYELQKKLDDEEAGWVSGNGAVNPGIAWELPV